MSAKDLKALAHRFFEEWSKGKVATMAAMDETCATYISFTVPVAGIFAG